MLCYPWFLTFFKISWQGWSVSSFLVCLFVCVCFSNTIQNKPPPSQWKHIWLFQTNATSLKIKKIAHKTWSRYNFDNLWNLKSRRMQSVCWGPPLTAGAEEARGIHSLCRFPCHSHEVWIGAPKVTSHYQNHSIYLTYVFLRIYPIWDNCTKVHFPQKIENDDHWLL